MKIHRFQNNPMVKKHVLITFLGVILGVLIYYYFRAGELDTKTSLLGLEAVLAACSGILVSYVVYGITLKLDTLLPWQTQLANRLFAGILIHFISAFIFTSGSVFLYSKFIASPELILTRELFIKLGIILFILMLFYTVIYFALYSYHTYSTLQIETVKQQRKQIDLQLKALKSQLSPHFLFNSLNSISTLIYSNIQHAETFIRRLANMYQYTLSSYDKKLISLEEELSFVNSYCYLLATRFENKFDCIIEIPEAIKTSLIPPLTLQMLVENAVKHNQMNTSNPLRVNISSDTDFIVVQNNITEPPQHITSFKIGLQNINERYLLLHNQGIEVNKGTDFSVKIPLIR